MIQVRFSVPFFCFLLLHCLCQCHASDHGHGSEEGAHMLRVVAQNVCGNGTVRSSCFNKLVDGYVSRFTWCSSSKYEECSICRRDERKRLSEAFFEFSREGDVVDYDGFAKASVALLSWTHDLKELCSPRVTQPWATLNYTDYLDRITGDKHFADDKKEWLEHVYLDIKASLNLRKVNNCETHTAILAESGANNMNQSSNVAETVAAYTVLHVLNGFKLTSACDQLPYPTQVMDSLYKWLGLTSQNDLVKEENLMKLMKALEIGSPKNGTAVEVDTSHDHHNHRRKRDTSDVLLTRTRRATTNKLPCLTPDNIYAMYGLNESAGLTITQFEGISLTLLQQFATDSCNLTNTTEKTKSKMSLSQTYGYGTLAVLIVSACSVFGVALYPCLQKQGAMYQNVMTFLIAMGVGTLIGDAVLHLIPMMLDLHKHEHIAGPPALPDYYWKLIVTIVCIYLMFFVEMAVINYKYLRSNSRTYETNSASGSLRKYADDDDEEVHSPMTTAYMVLIGDAIHNFADGVALGAAFSGSISGGISTSIAVFLHELPHEFGDFGVLLTAGFSLKKAILCNLISALPAFLGLYISIPFSVDEKVRFWIFSVTVGIFIYVAISNMMGTLKAVRPISPLATFLLGQIGILIGFLIMALVAAYEGNIRVDF